MNKDVKIVVVATKKGGVGKTAGVCNISAGLSSEGFRVAAIDMDSQGHLARSFGINKLKLKKTIFDVLLGDVEMKDIKVNAHGVDLYLANNDLSEFESTVNKSENAEFFPNTHILLKECINQIRDNYDFIIIDTAPSTSLDTLNALVSATDVIIPVHPEGLSVDGALDMLVFIKKIQKKDNPKLNLMGLLPTMVQPTVLHGETLKSLKILCMDMNIKVFDTQIRRTIKHGVAQTNGIPSVLDSENRVSSGSDYMNFIKEAFKL